MQILKVILNSHLFIPINDCSESLYKNIRESVNDWHKELNCEFSFYQMSILRIMQEKGSYFLWHIKTEGIELYKRSNKFDLLLKDLPPYHGTEEDFNDYGEILGDIAISLLKDSSTVEYDLSVLATLARNICIGCCYLRNCMDFGRETPILHCIDIWKDDFPFTISEYNELYMYRIAVTRGKTPKFRSNISEYASAWLAKIRTLLQLAMSLVR